MHRRVLVLALALVIIGGAVTVWLLRGSWPAAEPDPGPPAAVDTADPAVLGVFEGRVPCADCERTKVRLVLFRDPATRNPTTYLLERINVGQGNARHSVRGVWELDRGTEADSTAAVYRLDPAAPAGFRLYQAADDNILLFLNDDRALKIGDAGHSFTLSRTG